MTEHLGLALFPARAVAAVLSAFGILAIVLAAVGLYGVMAYAVARRTREVGIRMALGATSGDVMRSVLKRVAAVAGTGALVGAAGAFAAGKLFSQVLYGIGEHDPLTFAVAILIMILVAALASWVPARRAIRVDPAASLRIE
ncbi:MAG TPA: FtsX-like permease family protein [Bryobacteraceae bacterium]|nr:FtsX-like permease family protein [Bryobacteraceae bacterium]